MVRQRIKELLEKAVERLRAELDIEVMPEIVIDIPPARRFGDYSTNLAMVLASELGKPAVQVAERVVANLGCKPELVQRVEVAGGGFINFYLSPEVLYEELKVVVREDLGYGRSEEGKGKRVQVEFVSVNPTGPLHVGHGRIAAFGDALCNILEAVGYEVSREYYINDAVTSGQMENLAKSIDARYKQLLGMEASIPEDGYRGGYITDLASDILKADGDKYLGVAESERLGYFRDFALKRILGNIEEVLRRFGIEFDVWFSEQSLFDSGEFEKALRILKGKGCIYDEGGAIWFKASEYGHEKDEVIIRSTGAPTYLASDIPYHKNKYERGFDRLIDVWGADHQGHVGRTKAAVRALGYPDESLDIIVLQLVRLLREGEPVPMSTREGEFITLEDVIEEVGKDAARWFFLMLSPDAHLDFDLELAKRESSENPVYYVQYAHARICSILRKAKERGFSLPSAEEVDLSVLQSEYELDLIKRLVDLPDEVREAAMALEPHRLTRYASQLANLFHLFYTNCRVLERDAKIREPRLVLVNCARMVLRNVLGLLGIGAPERM